MHAPFRPYHDRPTVPDMPVDPPEMSDEDEERNERNAARRNASRRIARLIDDLDYLDHDGIHRHTQLYLMDLRRYLNDDMES